MFSSIKFKFDPNNDTSDKSCRKLFKMPTTPEPERSFSS